MRTSIFFAAVTFASLVACSSGDAAVGPTPGPVDPDSGSAPDPARDGAVADSGGPAPDATTKPDAATDTRIDPIEVGRSWTYDVTIIGTYPLCKAGSNTGSVLGQKVVGSKPAFQVQSFCPGFGTSSYAVDGDKVEVYYANAWILSLDSPVQAGHTWTDGVYNVCLGRRRQRHRARRHVQRLLDRAAHRRHELHHAMPRHRAGALALRRR